MKYLFFYIAEIVILQTVVQGDNVDSDDRSEKTWMY